MQLFLFIAAISATRRILAIPDECGGRGPLSPDKFREAMVDLAANTGAILAIVVTLYLQGRRSPAGDSV